MEEIKIRKKKNSRKKIVLTSIGIFLGCIILFGVSFLLSLNYIINPSPIVFGGGSEEKRLSKRKTRSLKVKLKISKVR